MLALWDLTHFPSLEFLDFLQSKLRWQLLALWHSSPQSIAFYYEEELILHDFMVHKVEWFLFELLISSSHLGKIYVALYRGFRGEHLGQRPGFS